MTRDKVIEKLKAKRMKNSASSTEISSFIAGWNQAIKEAIELLEKDQQLRGCGVEVTHLPSKQLSPVRFWSAAP